MTLDLVLGTLENAALLAVMLMIHHFAARDWRHRDTLVGQATTGLILGAFGVALMITGYHSPQGVFFDTRSVLLTLTGLFFSPVTTAVAVAVAVIHRLQSASAALVPAVLGILVAGGLGMALRRELPPAKLNWSRLYTAGILVHVLLLAIMLVLPLDQALDILAVIAPPVLLLYPLVFAAIGTLLVHLGQYQTARDDAQLLGEKLELATTTGGVGMVDIDAATSAVVTSAELEQQLGYGDSPQRTTVQTMLDRVHPDDRPHIDGEYRQFLASSTPAYHRDLQLEFRIRHRQGNWIWVRYLVRVLTWDAGGQPRQVAAAQVSIDAQRTLVETRHAMEEQSRRLLAEASESRRALLSALEDRSQTESRLRESQRLMTEMSHLAQISGWEVDLATGEAQVTQDSHRVVSAFGSETRLTLQWGASQVHPDDQGRMKQLVKECITSQGKVLDTELRFVEADGSVRWAHALATVEWQDGRAAKLRGALQDITRLKQAEEERRQSYEMLTKLAAQVPGCIFQLVVDSDGHSYYPWASEGVRDIYELSAEQVMADASLVVRLVHREDRRYVAEQFRQSAAALKHLHIEYRVVLPTQGLRWRLCSAMPERLPDGGTLWHGMTSDITGRKEADQIIWQQANFDALTGLPNRRMFSDRLDQEIKKSKRSGLPLALLFLDLDHFKEVNDTLGHETGDLLLQEVTGRLLTCVRDTDTVARLGGDEFIVILGELSDITAVERIAGRIIEELDQPFTLGGETVFIGTSIGITFCPDDATTAEDLLKNADQAMYAAKREGRHRFQYFTPIMQAASHQRMFIANDLRLALQRNELWLAYQPIVDLATGKANKAEALVRWQHPLKGLIGPEEFIPVAEDTGLIIELGDFVMGQAARQVRRWRDQLGPDFQVSINLSPAQLCTSKDSVFELWSRHMASQGLPGTAVIMEITEGLLLDSRPRVGEQLLALRDAGIAVALDDFGTGYSSLAYLKRFQIDFLKIDRTFIAQLAPDSDDLALCQAIIAMANKLGIQVVAEGVETEQQRDLLRAAGCHFAQGFLFAAPLVAEEFATLPGLGTNPGRLG